MRPRFFLLVLLVGPWLSGCLLQRGGAGGACRADDQCPSGQLCLGGACVPFAGDAGAPDAGRDASTLEDSGIDAGADSGLDSGTDAGPVLPAHCSNGITDEDESDLDCGGSCDPCGACMGCASAADCGGVACTTEGVCEPQLRDVDVSGGGTIPAYVREDGAVLLAHYAPGTSTRNYSPTVAQITNATGGAAPAPGWAPTPCTASGHLAMTSFDPNGRIVAMECRRETSGHSEAVASSTLFTSFAPGTKGTYAAVGSPGWGAIAEAGTAGSRSSAGMCGSGASSTSGGIAYCSGPGGPGLATNHLVSYWSDASAGLTYYGCGGQACSGAACDIEIWVWLL